MHAVVPTYLVLKKRYPFETRTISEALEKIILETNNSQDFQKNKTCFCNNSDFRLKNQNIKSD